MSMNRTFYFPQQTLRRQPPQKAGSTPGWCCVCTHPSTLQPPAGRFSSWPCSSRACRACGSAQCGQSWSREPPRRCLHTSRPKRGLRETLFKYCCDSEDNQLMQPCDDIATGKSPCKSSDVAFRLMAVSAWGDGFYTEHKWDNTHSRCVITAKYTRKNLPGQDLTRQDIDTAIPSSMAQGSC